MLRKLLSIASSLLIFVGMLLPMVPARANGPVYSTGGWSMTSSAATYDYDAETTTITYTVTRGNAPHALSHFSIATCHTTEPPPEGVEDDVNDVPPLLLPI